jgi:hypothetical protein
LGKEKAMAQQSGEQTPHYGLYINSPLATEGPTQASLGAWQYDLNFEVIDAVLYQLSEGGGGGGAVASVFGRTGAVTAEESDYAAFYLPLSTLTTEGDLLYEGSSSPARLPIGANGYVLTVESGLPSWQPSSGGFVDPMIDEGDMIYYTASLGATRLPIGTAGQVLTVVGGNPEWQSAASGAYIPLSLTSATTCNLNGNLLAIENGSGSSEFVVNVNGNIFLQGGGISVSTNGELSLSGSSETFLECTNGVFISSQNTLVEVTAPSIELLTTTTSGSITLQAGSTSGSIALSSPSVSITAKTDVLITQSTAATASANSSSPVLQLQGWYYEGGNFPDTWNVQNVLGADPTNPSLSNAPPSTLLFSHSGTGGEAIVEMPSLVLNGATPSVASGQVGFGNTISQTATSGNIEFSGELGWAGFLEINIGGTVYKIPFYNA